MKIIPALIKKNIQNSGDTGKQIYKNSKGHPITVSLKICILKVINRVNLFMKQSEF